MKRMTQQRRLLLDALQATKQHPTADELYETLRSRLPHISLGTVYRNLDVLARAGKIRKLERAGAQCRYDADMRCHYHVRCTVCGRIDDLWDAPQPSLTLPCAAEGGYQITGFQLEFEGCCPECSRQTDNAL